MNIEHGGLSEQDMMWHPEEPEKVEQPKIIRGQTEYETREGEKASLQWQAVYPKDGYSSEDEAVVFLPGVSLDADSKSVTESSQNFAEVSNLITYSITTRVENSKAENSQGLQAEAIQKFIAEKRLKEITLTGNSQGANKVGYVNHEVKLNSPEVNIRGIILTAPGGLYEQDGNSLTKSFFTDSLVKTAPEVIKNSKIGSINKVKNTLGRMRNAVRIGNDVGLGMAKEFVTAPTEFSRRVVREGVEAAQENPYWNEIDSPVVIIMGDQDAAFESSKVIPKGAHDKTVDSQRQREVVMKETFSNSPSIRVIEGSKDAVHGMHYIRGEKVPSVGWHMLQRMEREDRPESDQYSEL